MRQTKIIATVGPASDTDASLDALIAAGADILRLNFSHGTHDSHAATFARIRAASGRARRPVAVLQDLGGPKIRTGLLDGGRPIRLDAGAELRIVTGEDIGRAGRISTAFAGLARGVQRGDHLLLADGTIELEVLASDGVEIKTVVVEGGMLGEHKGINAPGVALPTSAITFKDVDDLQFGLELGVDLVALSFVQQADDLRRARGLIEESNRVVPLIAKIERPQAIDHLDEILSCTDMVMVARGDLGLELPLEKVPHAQKMITARARAFKVPVILATQVLESMVIEGRPTRAEVSDAANGVEDGVDAIMLSAETASGAHPARVVETLAAIITESERDLFGNGSLRTPSDSNHRTMPSARVGAVHAKSSDHTEAMCEAAVTLAERADADAIVAVTRGGSTARLLSALRPRVPVIATTDNEELSRQLAPFWGVHAVRTAIPDHPSAAIEPLARELIDCALIQPGAALVLVSINDDTTRIDTNYVKLQRL